MLFPLDIDQHDTETSSKRVSDILAQEAARLNQSTNTNNKSNQSNYYDPDYISSIDLQQDMKKLIINAITQLNYDTAIFIAELYYSECLGLPINSINRIQSIYLYSLSLYLNGDYKLSSEISEKYKSIHMIIAYIFAKCSLKLETNEENACLYLVIHLDNFIKNELKDQDTFIFMPNLATIHSLIGDLYKITDNLKSSVNHYLEAINKDPYLWQTLVSLNDMKIIIDLKKLYKMNNQDISIDPSVATNGILRKDLTKQMNNTSNNSGNNSISSRQSMDDKNKNRDSTRSLIYNTLSPFRSNSNKLKHNKDNIDITTQDIQSGSIRINDHNTNRQPTPLFSNNSINATESDNVIQQRQTRSTKRNINNNISGILESHTGGTLPTKNNDTNTFGSIPTIIKNKILTTPPTKLGNETQRTTFKTPRNKSNFTSQTIATTAKRVFSGQGIHSNNSNHSNVTTFNAPGTITNKAYDNETGVTKEFQMLFYIFTKVLKTSSQYNSYNAIRIMNRQLPSHILNNMPWCQAQLGKLHFEIVNYDMSLTYFTNLRRLQPTRLKDLEIFSTLLWHLEDKVNLSNLSSELLEMYPNSPETWCVLGNYFSLQKDHDQSIKALEKSTHIDPRFAYAYTLLGHEYANNESFDIAKTYYRKALACDPQHYNAYYGLGSCASQLGKFEEALLYFEKARMINPVNVVLICCCGTELEKLYHNEMALKYYEMACKLGPKSVLAKYRRAELLFTMNRYSVALGQFEELIKLDLENPNLHFMLGKILQALGRKKDAIREYTIALHLDPKGNQFVIDALESCHMQE